MNIVQRGLAVLVIATIAASACFANPPAIERRGHADQLIVDGKPFLILGGELGNSSASSAAYMRPIWPKLKQLNLNTVLAPVSWELIEAVTRAGKRTVDIQIAWEGRYVDGRWVAGRLMDGDQTHQGRHVRLPPGPVTMQRIRLYGYD